MFKFWGGKSSRNSASGGQSKSDPVTLEAVFVPGGRPTITYVPRNHLGLEDVVRRHIKQTREILLLIGPTKSGKTVLVQTVVPEDRRITVSGARVREQEARFWNEVAAKAGATKSIVRSEVTTTGTRSEKRAEISFNKSEQGGLLQAVSGALPLPSFEVGGSHSSVDEKSNHVDHHLATDPQEQAIQLLIDSEKVLVIEDFHAIGQEVQRSVIRALKEAVFEGLRVIVIGIPHRENDVVAGMIDMQGRTRTLRMPMWEKSDLREICDKGFSALNVKPAANVVTQFCIHAYGSPNLLQKFCLRLCEKHQIDAAQKKAKGINLGARYENFFEEFVAQESNIDVTRIVADFRSPRESRLKRYKVPGGEPLNIYQLVLVALSKKLPANEIAAGIIASQIDDMVEGEAPEMKDVTNALVRLGKLSQEISDEMKQGQPVIEYDEKLRKVHITDASFAFHVKWGRP